MADPATLAEQAAVLAGNAQTLANQLNDLAQSLKLATEQASSPATPFVFELTVFALAFSSAITSCGRVTPAFALAVDERHQRRSRA